MTKITFIYDLNLIVGFRMEGHAGYNVDGPDIVCSALSATSQMVLNGILDWSGLEFDDVVKECNAKEGTFEIEVPDELGNGVVIQQLFKAFELYMDDLEEQYKENITIERRQKDDL